MSDGDGDILVVGDTTIDLYPAAGDALASGSQLECHVGGTAANVARWAASLGSDTGLLTNVGTDAVGEMAARHLAEGPVDTTHVTRVDGTSPLTMQVPTEDGERWNAWIAGSCYGFTPPADAAALVAPYEWVHLEGVTLPPGVNQSAVRRLAEAAADGDTRVSFDLNGRRNQWATPDDYRQALRGVLRHCELVFAGVDDLAVAGVERTPAGLLELLPRDHSATVFLTDGAAATTALTVEDGAVTERATATPPATTVATTAGAGDGFAGAVLAARHRGVSELGELARVGNAAGAAAVSTVGPFDGDGIAPIERLL